MRFLKKGEKKQPDPPSGAATKAHPDLKVITGSEISGQQPRQPTPPQQQQQQNITLPNIKYKIAVASGKGRRRKIYRRYQSRDLLGEYRGNCRLTRCRCLRSQYPNDDGYSGTTEDQSGT